MRVGPRHDGTGRVVVLTNVLALLSCVLAVSEFVRKFALQGDEVSAQSLIASNELNLLKESLIKELKLMSDKHTEMLISNVKELKTQTDSHTDNLIRNMKDLKIQTDPLGSSSTPSFAQLLKESKSDRFWKHHYERYYEKWLSDFRDKPKLKFLEIGARDESLLLWSTFFSQPQLILGLGYGKSADSMKERSAALEAVSVYNGDQSKQETMDYLNTQGPWDVIIDDGSHVPEHILFSLFSLWENVKPGGLYVIEDLETNYWKPGQSIYGYELRGVGIGAEPQHSVVAKLHEIEQVLFRHPIGARTLSVMPGDRYICSIEWGMNIVAIRKCSEEEELVRPKYQKVHFDEDHMNKWIEKAKSTNPIVSLRGTVAT